MGMDMNKLMQQMGQMQEQMQKAQDELENETVESSAGGGMVNVTATGQSIGQENALSELSATIGILNAVLRPFVLLLTLPLNVLTLGLFTLVVNAAMLWMASEVVRGFEVHGFWSALGGWLLMSFFTFCINLLIGETGVEMVHVRRVVRL